MFGIVRPCRHVLGDGLLSSWTAHLCGLCLALRGEHGQVARMVTNYDGLVLSALTEAQSERSPNGRRTAGPCPLRGMRTASVVQGEGARLAATVSLVLASAKTQDHMADGDGLLGRRPVAAVARRVSTSWESAGSRTGAAIGFDTGALLEAVGRQQSVEAAARPGGSLLAVTEPTETATAAAFAHTARLAGRVANATPLTEAGALFGRLAHLLDAVEDRAADEASGAWNPITATRTPIGEVRRLCDDAVRGIRLALREVEFVDDRLVHVLLVHELRRSVDRAFGVTCAHGSSPAAGESDPYRQGGDPYQHGNPYQRGGDPRRSEGGPGAGGGGQDGSGGFGGFGSGGGSGGFDGFSDPGRGPQRRGLVPGCAAFLGLFCTCRMCCAKEYEGPWSRKKRGGACRDCDCCDCCECCSCDCGC